MKIFDFFLKGYNTMCLLDGFKSIVLPFIKSHRVSHVKVSTRFCDLPRNMREIEIREELQPIPFTLSKFCSFIQKRIKKQQNGKDGILDNSNLFYVVLPNDIIIVVLVTWDSDVYEWDPVNHWWDYADCQWRIQAYDHKNPDNVNLFSYQGTRVFSCVEN